MLQGSEFVSDFQKWKKNLKFIWKAGSYYPASPPRRNPPWRGEGAYLTKKFRPVRQQGEFVGATQVHSTRCQGLDSK